MNCDKINDVLADYLGDELTDDDRAAVDEHVADCAACRAEVLSLSATVSSLRSLEPPVGARPVIRRTATIRWRPRLLAHAAVLALGIGIGYAVRPAPAPTQTPVQAPSGQVALDTSGIHPGWVREWSAPASFSSAAEGRSLVRNLAVFTRSLGGHLDG